MRTELDLMLINPGGRERIYQGLGGDLAAIEPPLWCRLIAGYARDRGLSAAIIDSEAEEMPPTAVAERVVAAAPRLVVVVVFGHHPSASTQQMAPAGELCRAIKERAPDQPILLVGGHVSALPERTLREEATDFVCKGEGPVTVVQLVDALKTGGPLDEVEGLVHRREGEILTNRPAPLIQDIDRDLHGAAWDLLPMDRYRAHNWQCFGEPGARTPYASIHTALGCPYACAFCCINAPFGVHRYRMRSPEAVMAEIDFLVKAYGVRTFKIIDEMFVLNERHVTGLCDLLIQRAHGLNLWAYTRIDTVKPRLLDKLRAAGFRWLALGIESGSRLVREGSGKALKSNDIVQIIRDIQAAGINVVGNYIFGLPDDTAETMRETLDLARELNCEFANFYSAMAYPGSPLYDKALAEGWPLPETWAGYSQHSHDCRPLPTATLSSAEVLRFRDEAFQQYFTERRYLDMVTQRFGWDTRRAIEAMTKTRLKRKLLDEGQGG